MRTIARCMTLLLGLLVVTADPAAAQSGLEEADQLARDGRANEARASLLAWWDAEYAAAGRDAQQRALWLRGRLTVDPEQASRDFQRLVVLYPGGLFTDQALFRLAQAAHAMGDGVGARTHVEALVRDYPGSPARRSAEEWLRDAGDPPPPPPRAAATAATSPPASQRPATAGASPSADQGGAYAVQLGAFGEEERARAVVQQAVAAGFEARLVRVDGSPLLHVRVGSFAERPGAQALFERLAREGIQGAVVRDDRPERPAGS